MTTTELHPIIARRYSPRAFDPARPVESEVLLALLEAARWAPSSFNSQPWRFMVGQRGEATYARLLDALAEGNRAWAQHAPVLILTVAQEQGPRGPLRYAWHDVGLATAQLILQATALGLHAHPMAGFAKQAVRAAFAIPDEFAPVLVLAVGYLPEAAGPAEAAARTRLPLAEIAFQGQWGQPFTP